MLGLLNPLDFFDRTVVGRSLAIFEQQLGAEHPDTATNLNNLAGLCRAMGRYTEAQSLFERSPAQGSRNSGSG